MSVAHQHAECEQRTEPRVPLILSGRISVPADRLIVPCTIIDLSAGGAGLSYEAVAPRPELIGVLEIEHFGCFHGITIRGAGRTRGFRFVNGEAARNDLLKNMTRFVASGLSDTGEENRKRFRIAGCDQLQMCLPNGQSEQCRVIDISLDGIYLDTDSRPPIGHLVRVGRLYGRVLGHRDQGVALKFVSLVTEPTTGGHLSRLA